MLWLLGSALAGFISGFLAMGISSGPLPVLLFLLGFFVAGFMSGKSGLLAKVASFILANVFSAVFMLLHTAIFNTWSFIGVLFLLVAFPLTLISFLIGLFAGSRLLKVK